MSDQNKTKNEKGPVPNCCGPQGMAEMMAKRCEGMGGKTPQDIAEKMAEFCKDIGKSDDCGSFIKEMMKGTCCEPEKGETGQ